MLSENASPPSQAAPRRALVYTVPANTIAPEDSRTVQAGVSTPRLVSSPVAALPAHKPHALLLLGLALIPLLLASLSRPSHLPASATAKMSHDDHAGHDMPMDDTAADTTAASDAAASGAEAGSTAAMDHGDMGHMGMSPYLFARKTDFYVLFREAFVTDTGGFVGALFACFAFGILTTVGYEMGKRLESRARAAKLTGGAAALPALLVGALGHGLRLLLHYLAMLLVMTMSIWIILAVLLGHMFGFLVVTALYKGPTGAGKGKLSDDERDNSVTGCDC